MCGSSTERCLRSIRSNKARHCFSRRRRVRLPRGTFSGASRKKTHPSRCAECTTTGREVEKLDFDAPETWIRLLQGYTNVPRLMAAPNHFGCGGTPRLQHHDAHLPPEWQVCANNCHTTRVANIHRNGVRRATHVAFVPFQTEGKAGHRAFIRAVFC